MRALLAVLALLAMPVGAQTIPECEPQTQFNQAAPGSPLVWHWSTDGVAAAWWCLGIVNGLPTAQAYVYGGRYADGWEAFKAAAPRVYASANPWQQAKTERATIESAMPAVAPGSAIDCQRRLIRHGACVALWTTKFEPPLPAGVTAAQALEPGKCGPAPVCTAPPTWVVDIGTDAAKTTRPAFALANGVRSETSTGRATSGAECRPEVAQAPSGVTGKVFAAFGPVFAPGMVALCRRP